MARLKVLYRDRDLIVVHKPSGMNTYRDSKTESVPSALDVLKKQFSEAKVFPVHRLDRGTDGVLIFAFRPDVANLLQKLFREEKIKKTYWALVWGDPPAKGEWKKPLSENKSGSPLRASTSFRVLGRFETERSIDDGEEVPSEGEGPSTAEAFSWIECLPKTGRFHQIRRHAADAGFPIIGETEYGESIKRSDFYGLKRIALTAVRVQFQHPTLRRPVDIQTFPETTLGRIYRALGASPTS